MKRLLIRAPRVFLGFAVLAIPMGACAQIAAQQAAPTTKEKTLTLVFRQAKYPQLAQAIEAQTGVHIDLFGQAKEARVDVLAARASLSDVFDQITDSNGFVWWKEGDKQYAIADWNTYAGQMLKTPDLDAALKNLEARFGGARTNGADGTIHLTCPPTQKVVRGGPEATMTALGVSAETATGAAPEPMVNVVFHNAKIEQVAFAMRQQAKKAIRIRGSLANTRVSLAAKNVPLAQALDRFCAGAEGDVVWWENPKGDVEVSHKDYFQQNVLQNGRFEKCLDTLAKAHGLSWTKTSSPGGVDYTLQKAAEQTKSAASKAAPGAAAPAKDSAPAQPKAAPAAPKVAGKTVK